MDFDTPECAESALGVLSDADIRWHDPADKIACEIYVRKDREWCDRSVSRVIGSLWTMVQQHMEPTNRWKPKKHGLQNRNGKLWLPEGDLAFDLFTAYALPCDPSYAEARF